MNKLYINYHFIRKLYQILTLKMLNYFFKGFYLLTYFMEPSSSFDINQNFGQIIIYKSNEKQIMVLHYCAKIKRKFQFIVLPCVVGIATAGLIFSMLYFLPSIENTSTKYLLETSTLGLYIMCFISYYQSIKIKNHIPETVIPPRVKMQLKANHSLYTDKKTCQKQNNRYKPPRTSHCHICKCVGRMDHHCPYTNGCIGANNLKAFILFNFYGGLFAFQFLTLSIVFYFKLKEGVADLTQGQIVFWMFLNFFAFLLTFSMNGLWITNILLACKNITQLELLKMTFKFKDKKGTHPNPYDIGALSNLNSIFAGDYWMFWWPSQIINENDNTEYPMRPPVTNSDFKDLPESLQNQLKDDITKGIPKTIQELQEKYESSYEGVIFFYLGKQYKLTPKQVKDELRKITEMSSKQAEIAGQQIIYQQKKQQKGIELLDQKTEEQKQILSDLYGAEDDDINL